MIIISTVILLLIFINLSLTNSYQASKKNLFFFMKNISVQLFIFIINHSIRPVNYIKVT